jgi:DNA-binding response OmpR family regulator
MADGHDRIANAAPNETRAANAKSPEPVLVIDDDPDVLGLLVMVLREEAGMLVRPAHSVAEALRGQTAAVPALIVLDMSLPGEDAHDAVVRLRALPGWENVPIILCSGREDIAASASTLGAAGYLRKPFDLDTLVSLAERYARPSLA